MGMQNSFGAGMFVISKHQKSSESREFMITEFIYSLKNVY